MKSITPLTPIILLALSNTIHATDLNKEQGIKLYQAACQLCHAPDKAKAMKAPAAFDTTAWQQRFNLAKEEIKQSDKYKDVDDYFYHQITIGKGLMHHGGLCKESQTVTPNLKCDKLTYISAIHYMSTHPKQNKLTTQLPQQITSNSHI